MNLLFETTHDDIAVSVYWDYDDVDIDLFTDCEIVKEKIKSHEYMVAYVKVLVDCHGIKYENAVGGIVVESLDELKQEIEDQGLVLDTVDEFKAKLKNLVSVL